MSAGRIGRFFTFFVSIFFPTQILFAQQTVPLHFEALTINNGLSQGLITCITQDKKGFMWFATGDGLNKYDGYTFTVYHHDPLDAASLADDDITYVYEDSRERLWICTRNNGIDLFDRENGRFIHITHSDANSLSSNNTYSIAEDKKGIFWIRTARGIDRMIINENKAISSNGKTKPGYALAFSHINLAGETGIAEKNISPPKFFEDSRGNTFIYTYNTIYQVYVNVAREKYALVKRWSYSSVKDHEISDLLEDTIDHSFLLHAYNGVYKFDSAKFASPQLMYTPREYNNKWRLDNKGTLWMSEKRGITSVMST